MTPAFGPGSVRRAFARDVEERLLAGRHVAIHGPRGIGKTTLAGALGRRLDTAGVPCGYAAVTNSLAHIADAFGLAHRIAAGDLSQRKFRSRLRMAAEQRRGVLLLDHVTRVPTAARGFVRSLRGGLAGIAYFVDVDNGREHARLRSFHLGHLELEVPPISGRTLRRWLAQADARLDARTLDSLVRAAKGRPGFVVACVTLLKGGKHWHGSGLHLSTLAADAEVALRSSGSEALSVDHIRDINLAALKKAAESWKGTHHGRNRIDHRT
jgi:hypothetical protein